MTEKWLITALAILAIAGLCALPKLMGM